MQYIKASYEALLEWSMRMFTSPAGSVTKYKYSVNLIEGQGYSPATEDALDEIDIEYTLVDNLPIVEE